MLFFSLLQDCLEVVPADRFVLWGVLFIYLFIFKNSIAIDSPWTMVPS